MSNNPFETPASMSTPQAAPMGRSPKTAPGGLTAICVLCIILGSLGLLGSCVGVVTTAMQKQIQEMQQNVGDANQQKMQKQLADVQNDYFFANLAVIIINFVVAPALLFGSIGVLSRKSWGPKILKVGLLMAIAFVAIRTVIGLIMQYSVVGVMKDGMQDAIPKNAQGAQAAESFMTGALYAGIIFSIIIALGLMGFYLWSWTYLNKKHVKGYLATFS